MFADSVLQEINFDVNHLPDRFDSYFVKSESLWFVFTSPGTGGSKDFL